MLKKLTLTLFVVTIIALGVFAYPIVKNRYFSNQNTRQGSQSPASNDSSINQSGSSGDNNDTVDEEVVDQNEEDIIEDDVSDKNSEQENFLDVTEKDCDSGCKTFSDPEDLKYCREFCGLNPAPKDVSDDKCADFEDILDSDYCYKSLAIEKRDIKICDKIDDSNIKKSCRNRITEDIVDSQIAE